MTVKILGLVDIVAALVILLVDINLFLKIILAGALFAKGIPSLLG